MWVSEIRRFVAKLAAARLHASDPEAIAAALLRDDAADRTYADVASGTVPHDRVLLWCWRASRVDFIVSLFAKIASDAALVGCAWLLHTFVQWIIDTVAYGAQRTGLHYPFLLGLVTFMYYVTNAVSSAVTGRLLLRLHVALSIAVSDKMLAVQDDGAGTVRDKCRFLLCTALPKFKDFATHFHVAWTYPLLMVFSLTLLVEWLSVVALVALVSIFIFFVFTLIAALAMFGAQVQADAASESRTSLLRAVLKEMRTTIANSWQGAAAGWVRELRAVEEAHHRQTLRRYLLVSYFVMVTLYVSEMIMYVALDFTNPSALNPASVMGAQMLLFFVRNPLIYFPVAINNFLQMLSTLRACADVLAIGELKEYREAIAAAAPAHTAFLVDDVTVASSRGPIHFGSLRVERGKLTVVIGPTGSGKSLLLATLAGQLQPTGGTVHGTDPVALVMEHGFLFRDTIAKNIAGADEVSQQRVDEILATCQLAAHKFDGRLLSAEEVSGGEMLRISFARSLYGARDVVLLDDPVSALDPEIANEIVYKGILGALAGRTRVVATNHDGLVSQADCIVRLAPDGSIAFAGPAEAYWSIVAPSALPFQAAPPLVAAIDATVLLPLAPIVARPNDVMCGAPTTVADVTKTHSGATCERARPVVATPDAALHPVKQDTEATAADRVPPRASVWATLAFAIGTGGVGMFALDLLAHLAWRTDGVLTDYSVTFWAAGSKVFGYALSREDAFRVYCCVAGALPVFVALRAIPHAAWGHALSKRAFAALCDKIFFHTPLSSIVRMAVGERERLIAGSLRAVDRDLPQTTAMALIYLNIMGGCFVTIAQSVPYLIPLVAAIGAIICALSYYQFKVGAAMREVEKLAYASRAAECDLILSHPRELRAHDLATFVAEKHHSHAHRWATMLTMVQWWASFTELRFALCSGVCDTIACLVVWTLAVNSSQTASIADRRSTVVSLALCANIATGVCTTAVGVVLGCSDALIALQGCEPLVEFVRRRGEGTSTEGPDEASGSAPTVARTATDRAAARAVVFSGVTVRFGALEALRGITGRFEVGVTAIVGSSGAGKSTLLAALMMLVRTDKGCIAIEDPHGVTIGSTAAAGTQAEEWRRFFTFVPQMPAFFPTSLRRNVDVEAVCTDEQVAAALGAVGLSVLAGRLADDFSTMRISSGERQLVAFARALLSQRPIVLLDEPTSHMDRERRGEVLSTVRRVFAGRIVVIVSHQLDAVLAAADAVGVMAEGGLVEWRTATPTASLSDSFRTAGDDGGRDEESSPLKQLMRHLPSQRFWFHGSFTSPDPARSDEEVKKIDRAPY